jgi:hypothetical protein
VRHRIKTRTSFDPTRTHTASALIYLQNKNTARGIVRQQSDLLENFIFGAAVEKHFSVTKWAYIYRVT